MPPPPSRWACGPEDVAGRLVEHGDMVPTTAVPAGVSDQAIGGRSGTSSGSSPSTASVPSGPSSAGEPTSGPSGTVEHVGAWSTVPNP